MCGDRNNEFLCDPEGLLVDSREVSEALRLFRERTMVPCSKNESQADFVYRYTNVSNASNDTVSS